VPIDDTKVRAAKAVVVYYSITFGYIRL